MQKSLLKWHLGDVEKEAQMLDCEKTLRKLFSVLKALLVVQALLSFIHSKSLKQ
jgi:hypothetical protein